MKKDKKTKMTEIAAKTKDAVKATAKATVVAAGNAAEAVSDKVEDFMNKPEVAEATEDAKEAMADVAEDVKEAASDAKEAVKETVKTIRTKVSETNLEFCSDESESISVSISDIEKAVKKVALEKGMKGDIKIYINVAEIAAYYTVNGEGGEDCKVALTEI